MRTQCNECDARLREELVPIFEDDLLGLSDSVFLVQSVRRWVCDACGNYLVQIPNLPGLFAAAALMRALHPARLHGKDVAFLRRTMEFSGRRLAEALGVTPESVSRWENDKQPMSPTAEKAFRLMVCEMLRGQAPGLGIDDAAVRALVCASAESLRASTDAPRLVFQLVPSASGQGNCWVMGQRLAA